MDEARELQEGDVVAGKFRVERILAIGGMGVVAAAWHLDLEHWVALKVLRSLDADPAAAERFAREARAASRLESEHVVRIFDVGRLDDGRPYLVMEHLDGEDLEDVLAKRTLGVAEAVGYVLQACEAMAEAHGASIIHRDLKPANLFVSRRGDGRSLLKVLDFGIAKRVGRKSIAPLTGRRLAIGSPEYMSPEQTRGDADLGTATDIWSLGVCLHEMLVGETPFHAPSFVEVHARVLRGTARPVHEVRPDVPPELSEVIARCLEKDPAQRYPDVAALAADLERFAEASQQRPSQRARALLRPSSEPPTPAPIMVPQREVATLTEEPTRGRWRGVLAGIAALALLASGVLAWRSRVAFPRVEPAAPSLAAPAAPSAEPLPTAAGALPPSASAPSASPSAVRATSPAPKKRAVRPAR